MAEAYPAIVKALVPLATAVVEVRVSARGAWQVLLDSGLALELGREEVVPRIERFAAAWPRLVAQGEPARHADLRYANGFAMRQEKARK
jgi:cell division protein FtsQ